MRNAIYCCIYFRIPKDYYFGCYGLLKISLFNKTH